MAMMPDRIRAVGSSEEADDGPGMAPGLNQYANIRVVGVGGGGSNAIDRMIETQIGGVDFITVNTDAQQTGPLGRSDDRPYRRQEHQGPGRRR